MNDSKESVGVANSVSHHKDGKGVSPFFYDYRFACLAQVKGHSAYGMFVR